MFLFASCNTVFKSEEQKIVDEVNVLFDKHYNLSYGIGQFAHSVKVEGDDVLIKLTDE